MVLKFVTPVAMPSTAELTQSSESVKRLLKHKTCYFRIHYSLIYNIVNGNVVAGV